MAQTTEPKPARRQGNWRHRENRASPKYVSKRITEQDHAALVRYAVDHDVKIAELLAPFVSELVARAHDYCEQLDTAVGTRSPSSSRDRPRECDVIASQLGREAGRGAGDVG